MTEKQFIDWQKGCATWSHKSRICSLWMWTSCAGCVAGWIFSYVPLSLAGLTINLITGLVAFVYIYPNWRKAIHKIDPYLYPQKEKNERDII